MIVEPVRFTISGIDCDEIHAALSKHANDLARSINRKESCQARHTERVHEELKSLRRRADRVSDLLIMTARENRK